MSPIETNNRDMCLNVTEESFYKARRIKIYASTYYKKLIIQFLIWINFEYKCRIENRNS